ncbi:MAG: hypothetical protein E7319_02190 [Clostridiales bacterium]|nr:hypothetical protein [Clostridiales bacterium]
MGMADIKVPDLSRERDTDRKLQMVLDAMEQLKRQVQHALNHLGEESLSQELQEQLNKMSAALEKSSTAADKQSITSLSKRIERSLSRKAETTHEDGGTHYELWPLLMDLLSGAQAVQLLKNSGVTVDASGVTMADGSTLTSAGSLTAKSGIFSGTLTKGGTNVLTDGNIHIGSSEPATPTAGMIWIEPSGSSEPWDDCTVHYYKG